jgi:hypothetical protein
MGIVRVTSNQELKEFNYFPNYFNQHDPVWAPSLRSEMQAQFNPAQNPFLTHCEFALFLLKEDNAPMNNTIRKPGVKPLRYCRIYEQPF